jgi:predicted acyltransferase
VALVPARTVGLYEEGRNLSNYLDFRYMPGRKLNVYYENQGLLSPLSGTAVCLLGIFAGRWLKLAGVAPRRKTFCLLAASAVAIAIGLAWSLQFPIIKKLWSPSYCLVSAGLSGTLLAIFYLVVDVWNFKRWCQPFVWIGMNAITIYMVVGVVDIRRIASRLAGGEVMTFFDRFADGAGAVGLSAASLLLVFALARSLHRRKIFLRV